MKPKRGLWSRLWEEIRTTEPLLHLSVAVSSSYTYVGSLSIAGAFYPLMNRWGGTHPVACWLVMMGFGLSQIAYFRWIPSAFDIRAYKDKPGGEVKVRMHALAGMASLLACVLLACVLSWPWQLLLGVLLPSLGFLSYPWAIRQVREEAMRQVMEA